MLRIGGSSESAANILAPHLAPNPPTYPSIHPNIHYRRRHFSRPPLPPLSQVRRAASCGGPERLPADPRPPSSHVARLRPRRPALHPPQLFRSASPAVCAHAIARVTASLWTPARERTRARACAFACVREHARLLVRARMRACVRSCVRGSWPDSAAAARICSSARAGRVFARSSAPSFAHAHVRARARELREISPGAHPPTRCCATSRPLPGRREARCHACVMHASMCQCVRAAGLCV
jgi:hypothetical protein